MKHTSGRPRGAQRDPRSIVTPDAFEVSNALLGTPLAPPSRRLVAILVDLVVIGLLTALTQSFALVLGAVIAVLLVRAGFKRVSVPGSAFARAMHASVGCLGLFVGFVTVVLWVFFGVDMAVPDRSAGAGVPETPDAMIRPGLATAVTGATTGMAFANAEDLEAAEAAGAQLVDLGRDLGLGPTELRDVLEDLVPSDASWTSEADALIDRLVSEPSAATAPADPVAVDALAAEVRQARQEAAAAGSGGGFLSWLLELVDELGFGFGWATLYMTVTLSWWKGQTIGKRLAGIRVVRLDGEPITWWTAFERAGGYAAGFATGLLGFAQVYWDANRQAIHDRIVGTVVVREGAPKVIDWESTL
ncbi:MAG: RDD family protein [Gemmatimonadota bacterium]